MAKKRTGPTNTPRANYISVAPNINDSQQQNPLSRQIDRWLLYCKSEGMAAATIEDYTNRIDNFYWWYTEHAHLDDKIGWDVERFNEDHIYEYLAYQRTPVAFRWGAPVVKGKETLSPTSVFNNARVVRTFFNWLEGRHIIEKSPFSKHVKLVTKKDPVRSRHYTNLTEGQINQIYNYLARPENYKKYNGARNLAMFTLLLDSGMRLGELLSMRVCDIDWDRKRISIRGKTGDRVCFFSRNAERAMEIYHFNFRLTQEDHLLEKDKYWLCRSGKAFTEGGFSSMLAKVCQGCGIKFHAHQLRHTFASMMAKRVGVYELKELLGHSDINTTMIYTHGSTDANQEAHMGNSPLSVLDVGQVKGTSRRGRPKG